MPSGSNRSRVICRLTGQLVTAIDKLGQMMTPVAVLWYENNSINVEGTEKLKQFLKQLKKDDIETAIKEDIFHFAVDVNAESPMDTDADNQMEQQSPSSPIKLPFPLSVMNRKQKIVWLAKEILREQNTRTDSSKAYVKYGDPRCKPSFWLSDEWDWTLCKINLSKVKTEMYTGPGDFQDFLTRLIENCLSMAGKDPETFVESMNRIILKKKKKAKGIHVSSHIVDNPIDTGRDSDIDDMPDDNDAPEAQYIHPSDNQQSSFRPRRTLPDDEPPRYPESSGSAQPTPGNPTPNTTSTLISSQAAGDDLVLSPSDFAYVRSSRSYFSPARYLNDLPEPLHPGWKILENPGRGSCLFISAADHIYLKDFTVLRKYVHKHIIDNWHFYSPFYVFPLLVPVGSGNSSYQKIIENEMTYHEFLRSSESMISYNNTSNAEIIAIGNVMKIDIVVLTYKMQGREGALEDRTQWSRFGFNPDMADHNAFSIRCQGETLKLLHEDEVHYAKLIYLPTKNDYVPGGIEKGGNSSISSEGSLTRQRSNGKNSCGLRVQFNTESSIIVDNISNKKR